MATLWDRLISNANDQCESALASDTITYISKPDTLQEQRLTCPAVPVDPFRLEGVNTANFALRKVKASRFDDVEMVPERADRVLIGAGVLYDVYQIQRDQGGYITLILAKRGASLT
jgi:hypothetical protein